MYPNYDLFALKMGWKKHKFMRFFIVKNEKRKWWRTKLIPHQIVYLKIQFTFMIDRLNQFFSVFFLFLRLTIAIFGHHIFSLLRVTIDTGFTFQNNWRCVVWVEVRRSIDYLLSSYRPVYLAFNLRPST